MSKTDPGLHFYRQLGALIVVGVLCAILVKFDLYPLAGLLVGVLGCYIVVSNVLLFVARGKSHDAEAANSSTSVTPTEGGKR